MITRARFIIIAALVAAAGAIAALFSEGIPDSPLREGFFFPSVILIIAFTSVLAVVFHHLSMVRSEGQELSKANFDLSGRSTGQVRLESDAGCEKMETAVKREKNELENAVERLKRINDIGWKLTSIIDISELMKMIVQQSSELLNAGKVIIYLKNTEKPAQTLAFFREKGFEFPGNSSFESTEEYNWLFSKGEPFTSSKENPAARDNIEDYYKAGVPLKMKGRVVGAIYLEKGPAGGPFTGADLEFLTTLSNYAVVAIENALLYQKMKDNYFATIQSLVNALEASDRFTKGHSERVRLLSVELGRHIGLDGKELELLEQAAILHDIGKIGIDNLILQKQGRLTRNEYSLIKTHPLIGDEILGPIETLEEVRKTIIQHHERYDGKGYPYGLRRDEISVNSKILSVVDTFDAMMTDRPYRKAHTLNNVKEELKLNAGTQFDPKIVEAFAAMLDKMGEDLLSAAGYNSLYSF